MRNEEFGPIQNLPFTSLQEEIYTNARLKKYPDVVEGQVCTHNIFPMGVGEIKRNRAYPVSPPGQARNPIRAEQESRRRAKAKILDIARCNQFGYMGTVTIDGNKLDRYDAAAIYRKARAFLSNATMRHGMQYIMVPEYHRKKPSEEHAAIHMHMLCNLGTLAIVRATNPHTGAPLVDHAGRPVYNLPSWSWGFSAIMPLDDSTGAAAAYVAKYIAKSDKKIFGKYYLSSRGLTKSPKIIPLPPVCYDDFRDEGKLETGRQKECNIYGNTYLITEVLDTPGV